MASKDQSGESDQALFSPGLLISGALVGVLYGLTIRGAISWSWFDKWGGAMTFSFLLGVPFAMGFITIYVIERRKRLAFWGWVLWPWVTILIGALGTLLAFLEGAICIVMFLPIALACSSIGGLVAGGVARRAPGRDFIAGAILVFPLVFTPCESRLLYSNEVHTTENTIDIRSSSDVVWANIERVRAIDRSELPETWSHRIGFPNPVEATLSLEGVGGVRQASFTGGVLFIETVDVWDPNRRLGFSIKAQTEHIPATTLDEHVRVGGPFFDVLHGEYRIEPLGNGTVRLHLASQQRLSTDFNWYARMWVDATMSDLQSRILHVIRERCERQNAPAR